MANHKRRKRKDLRAGCLVCKPGKGNRIKKRGKVGNGRAGRERTWRQEYLAWLDEQEQLEELW